MTSALFLFGCSTYATKKDLADLQQKSEDRDKEINERFSKIEQAPKADPNVLTSLSERVEKIEKSTSELEKTIEPKAQMTLGVKTVTAEDVDKLSKKVDDLNNKMRSGKIALNSVSFSSGKFRVEDLSKAELSKLMDNASRIKEEKPSTVEIITWSDNKGEPDKKEKVASERAKNVLSFYKEKAGEDAKIEFLTVFKVATASGPLWRRADTAMWMSGN